MRTASLVIAAACIALALSAGADSPAEEGQPFDRSRETGLLALVPESEADTFADALEDAGGNWVELAEAVRALEGRQREACVWLIGLMPHLDRLEMEASTLVEHVRYAFRAADEMPYDVPEDMFEPYILTYRIQDEPVEAWRRELFEAYAPVAMGASGPTATARAISHDLARRVSVHGWSFFGPRQSPVFTMRAGSGTESEIAALLCAALKAVGIPSRQARVPWLGGENGGASWVEFYDGESWLPIYAADPNALGDFAFLERKHPHNVTIVETRSAFEQLLATESYTGTATIRIVLVRGGEPASGHEHFAVSVFNEGALAPLDALNAVADGDGRFDAVVGDGRYVVIAGDRDANGNPTVVMREVDVAPGDTVTVAIDLSEGIEGGTPYRKASQTLTEPVFEAVVLLDLDGEPSIRMLPLIADALESRRAAVSARWWYVGGDEGRIAEAARIAGGQVAFERCPDGIDGAQLPPGLEAAAPIERVGRTPLVVVYERRDGRVILHREGYGLGIASAMKNAIDTRLSDIVAEEGRNGLIPGEDD